MTSPVKIASASGIKRDGTQFDGPYYVDGQWCRFQMGRPRKMGGYRAVTSNLPEIVHGMHVYSSGGVQYAHVGSASQLNQVLVNSTGSYAGMHDRTPSGLTLDLNRLWQFEVLWDQIGSGINQLIAHGPPNLSSIDSTTDSPFYAGEITDPSDVTPLGIESLSGGVLVLAPYLLTFGSSGQVNISPDGDPNTVDVTAFVTGSKIVRGLPVRGNSSGPSGLLWSLDSLILATFTDPSAGTFGFNTLSAKSSVFSSQSILEYDGIYYWIGSGRFLQFNGVLQELPNAMNLNWFFDNVNEAHKQKVFAFSVPRYGEIWWCFPFGDATECTHAVIYNVREKTWYDTILPGSGRSAGYFADIYGRPFLTDVDATAQGYTFWQNEIGRDQVMGSNTIAIESFFETGVISMLTADQPQDRSLRVARIEPDFIQVGEMTLQVFGRPNARAPDQAGLIRTFPAIATTPAEELVNVEEVRRLMRFKFGSNVAGGYYQMGQPLAHIGPADGRLTS